VSEARFGLLAAAVVMPVRHDSSFTLVADIDGSLAMFHEPSDIITLKALLLDERLPPL